MERRHAMLMAGAVMALASTAAPAHSNVGFSVTFGAPAYVPPPVYYAPPPAVYYAPPPAVYYPPPRVYYGPPLYYRPPPHWHGHGYGPGRHGSW